MFDHVTIRVSDLDVAKKFYVTALAQLEFAEPYFGGHFFEWDDLSISHARAERPVTRALHVALVAPSRGHVDEFWRVLTAAGHRDNGRPGERRYHPGYYGAFVLDPDGNNIEAVCHNRD